MKTATFCLLWGDVNVMSNFFYCLKLESQRKKNVFFLIVRSTLTACNNEIELSFNVFIILEEKCKVTRKQADIINLKFSFSFKLKTFFLSCIWKKYLPKSFCIWNFELISKSKGFDFFLLKLEILSINLWLHIQLSVQISNWVWVTLL